MNDQLPNKRLHTNAAITLLFQFKRHRRGVSEPYRSAARSRV